MHRLGTPTRGLAARRKKNAPPAPIIVPGSEAFTPQLLAAMLAFREGNFTVRMPSDLTGIEGKIADAFNDIVLISERRARETTRVSGAVGKEGKLKQRMSVPGATGGWAD